MIAKIDLYFQCTHLSNIDAAKLRSYVLNLKGKMNLISSKNINNISMNYIFGKLVVIQFHKNEFNLNVINTLMNEFQFLKLLFIQYDNFNFSPELFNKYYRNINLNLSFIHFYNLSLQINSIRLNLYNLKYFLIAQMIIFQENFLYKSNIQYLC